LAPTVIIGNKKDGLEREEIKVEGLERKRLESKGLKEFVKVTVPPAIALLNYNNNNNNNLYFSFNNKKHVYDD
jgi:hypothetical protein